MTDAVDDSEPLAPSNIKRLQQVIGALLYYARMVENTVSGPRFLSLSTIKSYNVNHGCHDPLIELLCHTSKCINSL